MADSLAFLMRELQQKNAELQAALSAKSQEAEALRELADAASELQSQDVQAAKIIDLSKKV